VPWPFSTPFTGTRTIGVTAGASEPAFSICARLSSIADCRAARCRPRIVLHLEHDGRVFETLTIILTLFYLRRGVTLFYLGS
jgi:hypothetical protein